MVRVFARLPETRIIFTSPPKKRLIVATRRLTDYLDGSPELRGYRTQAHLLLSLQQAFARVCPADLARSSRVGIFRDGILSVWVDHGAVAAKLRQLIPSLMLGLRNQGVEVKGISVTVQVAWDDPPPLALERPPLSERALSALRQLEERLPDSPLKRAVASLTARDGKSRSSAEGQ